MDDLLKPNEIVIDSFFTDGKLKIELVSDLGERNIKELISYLLDPVEKIDRRNSDNKSKHIKAKKLNTPLPTNQLRKFYDSFLNIFNNTCNEEEKKIQLVMLKANSEYSAKRLNTNRFKIFMSNRIDLVVSKNGEDFNKNIKAFKLHFEALVAYYPKN